MCIAWPMRLMEILPEHYGMAEWDGVRRKVGLRLLPGAKVGDYVLVHAGCAIEQVKPEAAREQLALFRELSSAMPGPRKEGGADAQ